MKEASETTTTTTVNVGVSRWRVRCLCCYLITGWLHGGCRSHLLVGLDRLPEAHDHKRGEWEIREAGAKSELI